MEKIKGLSSKEVAQQIKLGNVNISPKPIVKSNLTIILSHIFNVFNAYIFSIALILILVQAYTSLFFIIISISNIVIRAQQEIRSKNTIAKLNLIVSPKTKVLRDDKLCLIDNEDVVLNDVIYFESGNQISVDSIVISNNIEVDESLLSGEVDPINKNINDQLLSGSFVISGGCYARAIHIGSDNYATKLINEARNRKPTVSELMTTFTKVAKITGYFIIPLSLIMVFQAYVIRSQPIDSAIINTAAAVLGMLPQGLILLTSVSLAASVVKLGAKNTLVQELFSIETLSRIDVLCLDKTGTLTEGNMEVQEAIIINSDFAYDFNEVMQSYVFGAKDNNSTFLTLQEYFGSNEKYKTINSISFSSARKWSALELDEIGGIIVGAPEFIIPSLKLDEAINDRKKDGARILLVAHNKDFNNINNNLKDSIPLAIIVISDPIRSDANETLKFFEENDVKIKIISGDNPQTVSAIAKQAGISNTQHYLDATTITTDEEIEHAILNYDIIGRATPYQKHKMILSLQNNNQKVAMTGDGVNDVLALKDADVSIAMGSGSDAARQIAHVVITDGKLNTLVDIVREGRLDINNITRSASMYYLLTLYTLGLSFLSILLNIPYPFIPFQSTLMDLFVEGFPSFMIMFERNIEKPKESIKRHCIRYSLPNALVIVISLAFIKLTAGYFNLQLNQAFTIIYFTTTFISIHLIYRIYKPINLYRGIVLIIDVIGFLVVAPIFWNLLELSSLNQFIISYIIIATIIAIILTNIISKLINKHILKDA